MSSPAKVIELNPERARRNARAAAEKAMLLPDGRRAQAPALGQAPATAELVWLSMSAAKRGDNGHT
jgi:hypothetical protein